MSAITKIQWCDSTTNPVMGCGGCELFPPPDKVLSAIAAAMNAAGASTEATSKSVRATFKKLVDAVFQKSENPHPGHKQTVNVTNIWHLRERFHDVITSSHGMDVAQAASDAIRMAITCYAGKQHLNKGANITDREGIRPGKDKPREVKSGYAPIFEKVTQYKGRSAKAAQWKDLLGMSNPKTPWKDRLPRMIFVSDMGDALSTEGDFQFLKADLMPAIRSDKGTRHLWLWLTKRPARMAKFADQIGGFPCNVCAMTTLTGADDESLKRLDDLKKVKASIRGLSIEPLWERIPPGKLDLKGIDWVIVGGESGTGDLTRPFALKWAEDLRAHCKKQGVAFFLKQLGRNPSRNGKVFKLQDKHGGNWDEWDESLRVREFPKAFHEYRADQMTPSNELRPVPKKKKPKELEDELITPEEKTNFKRLDKIVRKGVDAYWEAGQALAEIHDGKLWRAGGHKSWEVYCRSVAGVSRGYAHKILQASQCVTEMSKTSPIGDVLPISESQVRPLLRLPAPEQRIQAWQKAAKKAGGQPTAREVTEATFEVLAPEKPKENHPTRSQQRADGFERLWVAIQKRSNWDDVERLMKELKELL